MKHWYTIYTKPHSEQRVAHALEQKALEVFLPQIAVGSASTPQYRPFFPCYLFLKADLTETSSSTWQWTPGVRRLVSFDNKPLRVADEIVVYIRQRLSKIEASDGWALFPYKEGDSVRVKSGPLQDHVGLFDKRLSDSERVQILLTLLGRATRVQLDLSDLEPVTKTDSQSSLKRPRRTRGRGRPIRVQR